MMGIYSKIKQVRPFRHITFDAGAYRVAICYVTQGNESQAVVEFAPYQKLPLEKKKVDARNATIDQGML